MGKVSCLHSFNFTQKGQVVNKVYCLYSLNFIQKLFQFWEWSNLRSLTGSSSDWPPCLGFHRWQTCHLRQVNIFKVFLHGWLEVETISDSSFSEDFFISNISSLSLELHHLKRHYYVCKSSLIQETIQEQNCLSFKRYSKANSANCLSFFFLV